MDQYRGKLLKGDQVVIEPLGFTFENRAAPGGPEDWAGSFVDPVDKSLHPGETCRIVLEDGRSAEIVLGETEVYDDQPSRITFRARGPLS